MSSVSREFPGWTAEEIHAALDETARSAKTLGVLERVGLSLGMREGTGPDDDPLLRSQRKQAMQAGIEQGIKQGLSAQRELLRRQASRRGQNNDHRTRTTSRDVRPARVESVLFHAPAASFAGIP